MSKDPFSHDPAPLQGEGSPVTVLRESTLGTRRSIDRSSVVTLSAKEVQNLMRGPERDQVLKYFQDTDQIGPGRVFSSPERLIDEVLQGKRSIVLLQAPELSSGASDLNQALGSPTRRERIIGSATYHVSPMLRVQDVGNALNHRVRGDHSERIFSNVVSAYPRSWAAIPKSIPGADNRSASGFLNYVSVHPEFNSNRLSQLVLTQVVHDLQRFDVPFLTAYARARELARNVMERVPQARTNEALREVMEQTDVHEYVTDQKYRTHDGYHQDWGFRYHERSGGVLVCGLPCCSVENFRKFPGAFVVYPLRNRT